MNAHLFLCFLAISGFLNATIEVTQKNAIELSLAAQPKKVYAIFANDNTKGMTHALFTTAVQECSALGHVVDVLNLYDRASEIPFFKHDRKSLESNSFYRENKKRFMQADVLVIVFPVYWYSVPAILKAWVDTLTGWSYDYQFGEYAQPLHTIKKAIILFSCAQNLTNDGKKAVALAEKQMVETCKFIGITDVEAYGVDNVYGLQSEDALKHFDAVKKLCRSL